MKAETSILYKKTIVDLFAEQVSKTPHRIAVTFEGTTLTYQELDERSNQLGHYLKARGVKEETFVPICLSRSLEMIIGIMGILKAGGVYVPIDPEYPQDRIQYMLADTGGQVAIADAASSSLIKGQVKEVVIIDAGWSAIATMPKTPVPNDLQPNNLAYVIYTSGSTGRPKGVMIEHYNVVRLFFTEDPLYDFNERDVWTMFHSFCFDFSVWEMYGALLYGGKLVVVPKNVAKDSMLFGQLLVDQKVTVLNQTPSAFYVLQEYMVHNFNKIDVRYVIYGGEALNPSLLKPWKRLYKNCKLINMYGITETTVHVTYKEILDEHLDSSSSVIGIPIPTLNAYILDDSRKELGIGELGELYIGGAGLARGYLNLPQLTAERFIKNVVAEEKGPRLYKTGDLAKRLPDGSLEYFGRIDEQVKIRGFRIELGEIENVILLFPGIKNGVVVAKEDKSGDKRLVGYIVSEKQLDKEGLTHWMESKLPEYMIPRQLMQLDAIPLTNNGKADKKSLPDFDASELLTSIYVAPKNKTEENISKLWEELLLVKKIGTQDNFFELGGNSLRALRVVAGLKDRFNYNVPVTKLYQYPTVSRLAAYIDGKAVTRINRNNLNRSGSGDIAIIGMAGRFPGANNVAALWENLLQGKETVHFFKREELDPFIPASQVNDPAYVPVRGIIDGAKEFDPAFFGITPKLAEMMDPQQRIFLEVTWEALEAAGYMGPKTTHSIGLFAGCGNNTFFNNNVVFNRDKIEKAGAFNVMLVNDKDYVSTRTAFSLDLKGPAVTVQSACSTSLLAIAQAVESLRKGQCEVAVAGGIAITVPINSGHIYEEGAMLSNDGHCRTFDANARGTVFSDGAGVVLLKDKKQAEADGDLIYAVIKGVGLSNDGADKGSFTAPSAEGQAAAISMAIEDANVNPLDISYIEAHGTATPLGDPIEIDGLNMAFGSPGKKQYCAIGSIKSNIGHLTIAAGVAGLIKTALSLYHKKIPASINYSSPNPNIDFSNSPFFVNASLRDWSSDNTRVAGVSSFGVGGTNVHIVLEEFENKPQPVTIGRPVQLISWSAKTDSGVDAYAKELATYIKENDQVFINDIAYTLQQFRKEFNSRRFIVASSKEEAIERLKSPAAIQSKKMNEGAREMVFMFPGQGAQYINMGKDLYENEPVFKEAMDKCAGILEAVIHENILDIIYPAVYRPEAEDKLKDTKYSQPAIFAVEYSLAKLWMSWGYSPAAFIGHSIGEFVAAHLSGVFNLEDALKLIGTRGRLMSSLPKGGMLSVRTSVDTIKSLIPASLSIAAINSPNLCVIAGSDEDINGFSELLNKQEIQNRLLHTSHAFHSQMMDPVVEPFKSIVSGIQLNAPSIPIVSTVTGKWMEAANATDPSYWSRHLRSTVLFSDAAKLLLQDTKRIFLETGPGNVTSTLIRQHLPGSQLMTFPSLEKSEKEQSEYYSLLKALGNIWANGIAPDWEAFYGEGARKKLTNLPTYQFDRKVYWTDPVEWTPTATAAPVLPPGSQQAVIDNQLQSLPIKLLPHMRKEKLINKVKEMLENASGIEMQDVTSDMSFFEMGFDSLLLTQISLVLKKEFQLPVTFRQLNEEYTNLDLLGSYLDANLPQEKEQPVYAPINLQAQAQPGAVSVMQPAFVNADNSSVLGLLAQQINLLSQQILMMQTGSNAGGQTTVTIPAQITPVPANGSAKTVAPALNVNGLTAEEEIEIRKPFGASARIDRNAATLTEQQKAFLQDLTKRYNTKTKGSKEYTQKHRAYMADPRVVSGFKPWTKELVYSIVMNKSKGSKMWDIDGNEYIDVLNGFGSNMLGYQPDVIKKALIEQIEKGYEIGPQHELAGEVCKLICEFTNFDRAGLCNTGSEAVLGAMRIARTVTGRSTIVAFTGSYHGIMDEVIVRGTKKLKTFPASPGILPEAVQNMLILDYGTEESLKIIRERAHEFAAILVEPVQSRRPDFQPVAFLRELRKIADQSGAVLIFDEVISGFRFHPGGLQALFDIRADIGTYGKVAGAGISIGIIAGKKKFMDALDGGYWQYGDNSVPEAGVTYFAGTFVRHPLALATCKASLLYMKEKGPGLQEALSRKTTSLVDALNTICQNKKLPFEVVSFGSLWRFKFHEEISYSDLLFTLMREKGIHILDLFPCFLTEAHTEADLKKVITTFEESVNEMIAAGFFTVGKEAINGTHVPDTEAPVPGAKLGKDKEGNPAWFIKDPNQPGKFLRVK